MNGYYNAFGEIVYNKNMTVNTSNKIHENFYTLPDVNDPSVYRINVPQNNNSTLKNIISIANNTNATLNQLPSSGYILIDNFNGQTVIPVEQVTADLLSGAIAKLNSNLPPSTQLQFSGSDISNIINRTAAIPNDSLNQNVVMPTPLVEPVGLATSVPAATLPVPPSVTLQNMPPQINQPQPFINLYSQSSPGSQGLFNRFPDVIQQIVVSITMAVINLQEQTQFLQQQIPVLQQQITTLSSQNSQSSQGLLRQLQNFIQTKVTFFSQTQSKVNVNSTPTIINTLYNQTQNDMNSLTTLKQQANQNKINNPQVTQLQNQINTLQNNINFVNQEFSLDRLITLVNYTNQNNSSKYTPELLSTIKGLIQAFDPNTQYFKQSIYTLIS
jgi:hypothetical protein